MGRYVLLVASMLFCCNCVFAETLVFTPLPMENPKTVASQWKPLLEYLQQKLDVNFQVQFLKSNQEVIDRIRAGKIDLAYLGPLPYIALKDHFPPLEPIVLFNEKNGAPIYTCAIISREGECTTLKDLHGKKIALTQPLSTCGYFATEGLLRQFDSSLEDNLYRYLTQHDKVALSVVRGEFDLGGLKTAIALKYKHLGLNILSESGPFPGLALVVNTERVSAERINQIRQALMEANEDIRRTWGDNVRYGVTPATDADYNEVRKHKTTDTIPEQGNF